MKLALAFLLSFSLWSFAQAPFNATNLRVTNPPVQSTTGSISRFFSLSPAGVGETVTPTKLWDAVVATGTVDTSDISGFSTLGRSLVDDVTTTDMQTTLGSTTVGRSYFTLTNPSAITFPRQNANNTVTSRTAAELKTDLALDAVNNTADAAKPVSTATQTALDLKLDRSSGETVTLGAGATNIAVTETLVALTGDAGSNTISTITGGLTGMVLVIKFQDGNVTITDTAANTTNTVNLSAAWTSTASDTLTLVFDGTKWFEISRSVN